MNADRFDSAEDPMAAWEAAGFPCDECDTPQRLKSTDEGLGFFCPTCEIITV